MDKLIWQSKHSVQDVVGNFVALADKPNVIDRNLFDYKSFNYKYLGSDECRFTLWFHFAWHRASYQPAPFQGTIKASAVGCRVEVHPIRWVTIVDSAIMLIFIAICYLGVIAAPIAGFKGWAIVSIVFITLATSILMRFLFTRKKWLSENVLLGIVNCATDTRHQ